MSRLKKIYSMTYNHSISIFLISIVLIISISNISNFWADAVLYFGIALFGLSGMNLFFRLTSKLSSLTSNAWQKQTSDLDTDLWYVATHNDLVEYSKAFTALLVDTLNHSSNAKLREEYQIDVSQTIPVVHSLKSIRDTHGKFSYTQILKNLNLLFSLLKQFSPDELKNWKFLLTVGETKKPLFYNLFSAGSFISFGTVFLQQLNVSIFFSYYLIGIVMIVMFVLFKMRQQDESLAILLRDAIDKVLDES